LYETVAKEILVIFTLYLIRTNISTYTRLIGLSLILTDETKKTLGHVEIFCITQM